jgi:transposase
MSAPGGKAYRPWTPELYAQQAHAPAAELPEDDLVFFLLDVVPTLDLARIHAVYQDETRGAPPFDPALMTCLLLYAYCVGVFSSRKIAHACERNLAFLAIVGPDRPDFRTISLFRKTHLDAFADVFVQVLRLARAAGLVHLGCVPRSTRCSGRPRPSMRRTTPCWARGAAMSCPMSCVGGRTAWRRSRRR